MASGACPEFHLCHFPCPAFSMGRFVCPFTFGGFRASALVYAVYTIPVHIAPGCSRYYIPSLGAAVGKNTSYCAKLETFHEFQPLPRMYAHYSQYLFPSRVATSRMQSAPLLASYNPMNICTQHLHLPHDPQPGLRKPRIQGATLMASTNPTILCTLQLVLISQP